ncbi:MAG: hypothetical protein DPW09_29290 [Anaerolineae bacterium]|nr:hypothetical protein [Anaerolineales bacterium]MCQ3977544.1 hypothetical protein [Anaerolineae bacterium]
MGRIWSWFAFAYGVICLIVLALGFGLIDNFASGTSIPAILVAAAVAAALAGGIGGATAMLQRLGRDLSDAPVSHSFFSYLLQPLTGLVAGILSLFLVSLPGALLVNYATTRTFDLAALAASSPFVALSLLLAWLAGYQLQSWWAKRRSAPATKTAAAPNQPAPASPLAFQIWAEKQQRMSRWSVTWGVLILVYGLIWLVVLLAGLIGSANILPATDSHQLVNLLAAGWPALLAGGIGGVIGMLYDLYRRISFARDFDRQHILAYLVLPLTGLVLGGAMYLFIASGYFSYQALVSQAPLVVDAPAVIVIYLVLGWVAGFRQGALDGLTRRLIQSVIGFFRSILSLLSPKLLWDQASRADALSEIAQQRELFRPLDRD